MSICPPHKPPIRNGLQGPTKEGQQRELGTPSLTPALAHLPLANQGNHVALLADHVDRSHTPSTVSLWLQATPSMKTATGNTQGAGRLPNWAVAAGTGQGVMLACLLEFEWHWGGITQLVRQHLMHGHRWHIVHGPGEITPLVARHWGADGEAPFLSHALSQCPSASCRSHSTHQGAKRSVERPLKDPTKIWCRQPRG